MGSTTLTILRGLVLTSIVGPALAGNYALKQSNVGTDFLSNFQWENISDPTNGRVYVAFSSRGVYIITLSLQRICRSTDLSVG